MKRAGDTLLDAADRAYGITATTTRAAKATVKTAAAAKTAPAKRTTARAAL